MLLVHHTATDTQRYLYTIRTPTNELFWEMAGRKGARQEMFSTCFIFTIFRSESVCKVKTVWAGDHVVWSRISSILLFYVFLHSWKMIYFLNLLYTLLLRFGYHFSRLTVRCLFEGSAQLSETSSLRITQLYVILSSFDYFFVWIKTTTKAEKKWDF